MTVCWNMGEASRDRAPRSPLPPRQSPGEITPRGVRQARTGVRQARAGVRRAPPRPGSARRGSRGAADRPLLARRQAQLCLGGEHADAGREARDEADRARLRQPDLELRAAPELRAPERPYDDLLETVARDLANARLERAATAAAGDAQRRALARLPDGDRDHARELAGEVEDGRRDRPDQRERRGSPAVLVDPVARDLAGTGVDARVRVVA